MEVICTSFLCVQSAFFEKHDSSFSFLEFCSCLAWEVNWYKKYQQRKWAQNSHNYYTDQELQYGSKSPSTLNLTFSVKEQAVVKRQLNYVGRLEDKGCFRRAVHKSMGFNTLYLRIIILLPPHGKASSTWEFYFLTCKKQKEGQSETLAPAVCEVPLAQNNSYTKVED